MTALQSPANSASKERLRYTPNRSRELIDEVLTERGLWRARSLVIVFRTWLGKGGRVSLNTEDLETVQSAVARRRAIMAMLVWSRSRTCRTNWGDG